jgi:hypothetical protein
MGWTLQQLFVFIDFVFPLLRHFLRRAEFISLKPKATRKAELQKRDHQMKRMAFILPHKRKFLTNFYNLEVSHQLTEKNGFPHKRKRKFLTLTRKFLTLTRKSNKGSFSL